MRDPAWANKAQGWKILFVVLLQLSGSRILFVYCPGLSSSWTFFAIGDFPP
jgi:hypothetical protein